MWTLEFFCATVFLSSMFAHPFLEVTHFDRCDKIAAFFENYNECVNFVVNLSNTEALDCFNRRIVTSMHVIELTELMQQNVSEKKEHRLQCELLIFVANSQKSINTLFSPHESFARQRFYPFTNILIINESPSNELHFSRGVFEYLVTNALNVIWLKKPNPSSNVGPAFNRVIFNDTISVASYDASLFEMEKFVDFLLKDELQVIKIRASFFNCPPFVLYPEDKSIPYDGVEYRCLQEISKNWKRKNIIRDFIDNGDPWQAVLADVKSNVSDIALCSIWMTLKSYKSHSLSRYYDTQCTTFLVPNPKPLSQASLIYMPLDMIVWLCFITSVVITAIFLRLFAIASFHIFESSLGDARFTKCSTLFMDVINIATSHGLPQFSFHNAIKLLVLVYMFFTLLLGTSYTTRYTSLLALPRFSKSIETFKDYAASDITWGDLGDHSSFLEQIRTSGIAEYMTVADRFHSEASNMDKRNLIRSHKYSILVQRLNNFVTNIEGFPEVAEELHVMKQCLFNYFSVFAFNYHSPFKRIFDRQITRFLESGIMDVWFRDITTRYGKSYMFKLLNNHSLRSREPIALSVHTLIGAFIFLFCGVSFSALIFMCELILFRIKSRK